MWLFFWFRFRFRFCCSCICSFWIRFRFRFSFGFSLNRLLPDRHRRPLRSISSSFVRLSRVESVAFQWQVRVVSLSTHQAASPSACQFVAAMMVILNHNCCRPRFHYADTICMYVCICHIHIYIFYMCNELFKPGLTSISPRLPVPPSLLPLFSFALAAFVAQFRWLIVGNLFVHGANTHRNASGDCKWDDLR